MYGDVTAVTFYVYYTKKKHLRRKVVKQQTFNSHIEFESSETENNFRKIRQFSNILVI